MTRTYTARGPHKRTCDLCDAPILPGDRVAMWAWVAEEIQDSNIMRVHETCNAIYERESMEDFTRGHAFEDSPLEEEARQALAKVRRVSGVSRILADIRSLDAQGAADLVIFLEEDHPEWFITGDNA